MKNVAKIKQSCPYCCTFPRNRPARIQRIGHYRRASNPKPIARFLCRDCGRKFSESTTTFEYRQRKRDINEMLFKLLANNVTMRGAAKIMVINRKTVDRRLPYFARVAEAKHSDWIKTREPSKRIQFDDMETSEHTKLKPLSVPIVVDHPSRMIISYDVAQMPAKGLLAKISVTKYGKRKDLRHLAWKHTLSIAATTCESGVVITSDSHKRYPEMIRRFIPASTHVQTLSRRACVAGQGELKKGGYDPLFTFNHTAAMHRAHISRLIRKTWCTTKRPDRLRCHLALYVLWHNEIIAAKLENREMCFPFAALV